MINVLSFTGKSRIYTGLHGCSLALALAELSVSALQVQLVVTPDHLSAYQLHEELRFFLDNNPEAPPVFFFPDWETLPYDPLSPHQDILSERLSVLNCLPEQKHAVIIACISTLMHRLCPVSFLQKHAWKIEEQQLISSAQLQEKLLEAGYHQVTNVIDHGEFTLHGTMIDLFPMGNKYPVRIELANKIIQHIRRFDPNTQRTLNHQKNQKNCVQILPAREFPMDAWGIKHARRAFRDTFSGNPSHCPWYEALSTGQCLQGSEYYLPLFFAETASIFDYLPENTNICLVNKPGDPAERFWQEVLTRHTQHNNDLLRPPLQPQRCFIPPVEFFTLVNQKPNMRFESAVKDKHQQNVVAEPANFPMERNVAQPLRNLIEFMAGSAGRTLLVVESAGRREFLLEFLQQSQIYPKQHTSWQDFLHSTDPINIIVGPLMQGAEFTVAGIHVLVQAQWLGEARIPQRKAIQPGIDPDLILRNLAELNIGAPVVHLQFGIGRYQGLQTFEHDGQLNEFLILSYAGDDKIYVPVTSLHWISRYTGADSEHAPMHRLGSDQWEKAKKKATEKIHDLAIELLDIYAQRAAKPGYSCHIQYDEYQRFANAFPFTETPDQTSAIEQIMHDMQAHTPMDRLICGDVGFGKTEVAMRAAFIAVQNNKQVCVLVPTTLLAGQHLETFRDRFADFPVNIALLSRFKTAKETAQIIDSLAKGQVDIVIGTHKLFQKNMPFERLGLLIIDEEHRFGVKQKEHIKSIRTHVDVLSMTATPIPRTLNMAMAGMRDLSLITTPPAKRLAIKTFWQERDDTNIREAILREILRGGQVFFLHNQVHTIERICLELKSLVPEANIRSAHGQMRERELERIMADFYHHRFNVLVCTTIIETGIDIPTANTIIIDQAFHFGLAQLHQLRGRVGRSQHQAYAYLLTPNKKSLTPDAVKRLEAIVSQDELGSGFMLATQDLEIRGAGELLGEGQSGNVHAIGFTLFMELLDNAVSDLKSGKIPELNAPMNHGPDIDLRLCALLPEEYLPDVHMRLVLYKRIANAQDHAQLRELKIEMIDRFGSLPVPVQNLFLITELRFIALDIGVKRIQSTGIKGHIEFNETPQINANTLINLIQVHSTRYKLQGPKRLNFVLDAQNDLARIQEIIALLKTLSN